VVRRSTAGCAPTDAPGITRPRDYERATPSRRQHHGTTFGMANLGQGVAGTPDYRSPCHPRCSHPDPVRTGTFINFPVITNAPGPGRR